MSRYRSVVLGLLAAVCCQLTSAQYPTNMFLNGEYQNGIKGHPSKVYAVNPASNVFLEHAIISREAAGFQGPTYLPPEERLTCGSGQQCVLSNQCQGGYFTQQLQKLQNCKPSTHVCCTYRPQPTTTERPYKSCQKDHDCVPPNFCNSGEIDSPEYVQKSTPSRCYAPDVCCRIPTTTLTVNGYLFRTPEQPFTTPTRPTTPRATQPQTPRPTPPRRDYIPPAPNTTPRREYIPPAPNTTPRREYIPPAPNTTPRPTQSSYRPQPTTQPPYRPQQTTQPAYRPQPTTQPPYRPQPTTQPAYRPQPTQPAYRPESTTPRRDYLPPTTSPRQTQPPFRPQPGSPDQSYRPQPSSPDKSYRPQPGSPNQNCRPQPGSPDQNYRPQPGSPDQSYRPQPGSPDQSYRPQPGSPDQKYRPQPGSPDQDCLPQPGSPDQNYRPQPGSPDQNYRPQPGSPDQNYRPQPGSPDQNYRPQPGSPDQNYRPQPGSPDQNYATESSNTISRTVTPRPNVRPTSSPNQYQPRPSPDQYQPHPKPDQYQPQPKPDQYQPHPKPGQNQPHPKPDQYQPHPKPGQNQPHPKPDQYQPHPKPDQYQPHPKPGQNQQHPKPDQYQPRPTPGQYQPPVRRGEDNLSPQIFPNNNIGQRHLSKCASALECTPENMCNSIGVIIDQPIELTPAEKAFRVPLTDCSLENGAPGKCCRDANYVDPWPINLAGVCATRNSNTSPKGIQDFDANFGEIPWQAMILKESTKTLVGGGAVIGDQILLTAASVVKGLAVNDVKIKAGEWELGRDSEPLPFQIVGAKSIDIHPDYNPSTGANDMAVIRLDRRLEFAQHIKPICVSNDDPKPNEKCVVTGWGKQALNIHEEGAVLHVTNTKVVPRSECGADESSVCSATTYDACQVDIGSALACGSGSSVLLKGIYTAENACGEGQAVRFSKPDLKWVNAFFTQQNKATLQKRRV